jgi:hypothetical protein
LKPLRFTDHAEVRLARRGLDRSWVEATATDPEWREPDSGDPAVERRFAHISEAGGRVLRVVCVETVAYISYAL